MVGEEGSNSVSQFSFRRGNAMLSKHVSTWISSIVIRRNSRSSGLLARLGIGIIVTTCLYSQGLADEMMVLQLDGKSGYVELPRGAFDRLESATVEGLGKVEQVQQMGACI